MSSSSLRTLLWADGGVVSVWRKWRRGWWGLVGEIGRKVEEGGTYEVKMRFLAARGVVLWNERLGEGRRMLGEGRVDFRRLKHRRVVDAVILVEDESLDSWVEVPCRRVGVRYAHPPDRKGLNSVMN